MAKIKSITLKNIKFFGEPQTIELGGKHTLIYGENGSGKSSLYWALYRILASANKIEPWEIEKYFEPVGEYSWLNVYEVAKGNSDAEISLLLDDNSTLKLTQNDFSINQNTDAQEANMASEFLSYKFLYKLLDFTASEYIDLFGVFYQQLFPYIRFQSVTYWRENKTTQVVEPFTASNALQIYNFVNNGPQKIYPNRQGELRFPSRTSQPFIDYKDIVDGFEASMHQTMSLINVAGNPILKNSLGNNITFEIKFVTVKPYQLSATNFEPPEYKIELIITDYEGMGTVIKKPHVFLNEAKLTAVGLAIRLAVLKQRLQTAKLKILVLDDLLISLDMSNREKVLELIFSQYLSNYQVFILTHDRVLFEFVRAFIKQKSNREAWTLLEMYEGGDVSKMVKQPVIIDSKANYFEKAESYFKAKDYTACAFYLRKEIERLVKERLTEDDTRTFQEDQKPHSLKHLWGRMCDRYEALNNPVSKEIKTKFESSMLLVMNAQAHDNLSLPVYRLEIEKALEVVKAIEALKIPNKTFLLTKGMKMRFRHPHHNYSFDFELLEDFYIDNLDAEKEIHCPKCKPLTWQYEGSEFWDFKTQQIGVIHKQRDSFSKILSNLLKIEDLNNTQEIILKHTKQVDGIWSLKDIIDKANLSSTKLFS